MQDVVVRGGKMLNNKLYIIIFGLVISSILLISFVSAPGIGVTGYTCPGDFDGDGVGECIGFTIDSVSGGDVSGYGYFYCNNCMVNGIIVNFYCLGDVNGDGDRDCIITQIINDEDNDGIIDEDDLCPNSLPEEVDQSGCDIIQFCKMQNQCGMGCDGADWMGNEADKGYPGDCRTVIIEKEGKLMPYCAGLTCAD